MRKELTLKVDVTRTIINKHWDNRHSYDECPVGIAIQKAWKRAKRNGKPIIAVGVMTASIRVGSQWFLCYLPPTFQQPYSVMLGRFDAPAFKGELHFDAYER